MLRSSGGKCVVSTNRSAAVLGDRHRAGIGSSLPCGGFQHRRIVAGDDLGLVFCFAESSTPCLAFENSSCSGYMRPPSSRSVPLYSVSLPDLTQASISD